MKSARTFSITWGKRRASVRSATSAEQESSGLVVRRARLPAAIQDPGDRAQREKELGPLAPAVSKIPAPDLRGMGCPDHQPVILGGRLLSAAAREAAARTTSL